MGNGNPNDHMPEWQAGMLDHGLDSVVVGRASMRRTLAVAAARESSSKALFHGGVRGVANPRRGNNTTADVIPFLYTWAAWKIQEK